MFVELQNVQYFIAKLVYFNLRTTCTVQITIHDSTMHAKFEGKGEDHLKDSKGRSPKLKYMVEKVD